MKRLLVIIIIAGIALLSGCTENFRAKNFGGTMTYDLEKGTKLELVTWKDDQLWYLVRPMTADDKAITYEFKEKSSFGAWEGTITIKEYK